MKKDIFDKEFIEQQKQALLAKKSKLESELDKRGTKKDENSSDYEATYQEYGDDEESNAAEYAQTETNINVVNQLETELNQVIGALDRISKGSYGIDIESRKPINKKRLIANPAAETDISHEKE